MNSRRLLLVVALLLVAADGDKDQSIKKELDKLMGTWILDSETKKLADGSLQTVTRRTELTIDSAGTLTFREKVFHAGPRKGNVPTIITMKAKLEIDPSSKPKRYQVTTEDWEPKGKPQLGVYELNGDTLKLCYLKDRTKRPQKVSLEDGGGDSIFTYKRELK